MNTHDIDTAAVASALTQSQAETGEAPVSNLPIAPEIEVRAILSKYFGGGEWTGRFKPRFTPAARDICALFASPKSSQDTHQ